MEFKEEIHAKLLIPEEGTFSLPLPSRIELKKRYTKDWGEAIDGPYATTFRYSYDSAFIKGQAFYNTPLISSPTIMSDLSRALEIASTAGNPDKRRFCTLTVSRDGVTIFRLFGQPYGFKIENTVMTKSLDYELHFIGSKQPTALNTLLFNISQQRYPFPMTSGKWQV